MSLRARQNIFHFVTFPKQEIQIATRLSNEWESRWCCIYFGKLTIATEAGTARWSTRSIRLSPADFTVLFREFVPDDVLVNKSRNGGEATGHH